MKATEKYFPVFLFVMLYKVILIFVPVTQNPEVRIFITIFNLRDISLPLQLVT